MPTYVRTDKCDGCRGRDQAECMYILAEVPLLAESSNGRWATQLRSSFAGQQ